MKKKLLCSILAVILAIQLVGVGNVSASASTSSNFIVRDSNVSDISSSTISYISEGDALLLAEQCIAQQIEANDHCSWNSTTRVNETVKLYDFENKVNSYLFRLITNNKKEGYIFINASSDAPSVQAFGYDCNFMLDQMYVKSNKRIVKNSDHIISANNLTFLQKVNNSQVKELSTNAIVEDNIENLNESYKQSILQAQDNEVKSNFIQLKNNITQDMAITSKSQILGVNQVIYDQANLANIWNNTSENIFRMDQFPQTNHCGPTAGTNFIYYWSHLSPNKIPQLWTTANVVESKLYSFFYTNITTPGTMPYNIVPGLSNYGSSYGHPIAGSDYVNDGTNWSWYIANIKHNLPILFTVAADPHYQQHVMLIVRISSDGKYLRIADGWSSTYSNFYKQSVYIINACYVRW